MPHPSLRAAIRRRSLIAGAAAGVLLAPCAGAFAADPYPSKPIHLLVGFTPGTATDLVARLVAERITRDTGWTIIVENRPGQAGSLAALEELRAAPDGYTLLITANGPMATNPALYPSIKYDATRDFTAIGKVAVLPYMLSVSATSPIKDVAALLADAKARPGTLNYGSPGIGSTSHLITATFATKAGIDLTHIPYKGSPEVIAGTLSGNLDLMIDTSLVSVPLVKSGRLRPLAMTTAARLDVLPDVPTLSELGIVMDMGAWVGVVGPAGLPPDIVAQISRVLQKAVDSSDVHEKLAQTGSIAQSSTPEAFKAYLASEVVKWAMRSASRARRSNEEDGEMIYSGTLEAARGNRFARITADGKQLWRSLFFGPPPSPSSTVLQPDAELPDYVDPAPGERREPQAFLIEQEAGAVVPPHFHYVDQFQVVVKGGGKLGSHAVEPVSVHFARANTGYGPILPGDDGLWYFTFRASADETGAQYLPGARSKQRPGQRRNVVADRIGVSEAEALRSRATPELETQIEEGDGLGIFAMRLGPGQRLDTPTPGEGHGLTLLVFNGEATLGEKRFPRLGVVYVSPDEAAQSLRAGDAGAEVLVMRYPKAA